MPRCVFRWTQQREPQLKFTVGFTIHDDEASVQFTLEHILPDRLQLHCCALQKVLNRKLQVRHFYTYQ